MHTYPVAAKGSMVTGVLAKRIFCIIHDRGEAHSIKAKAANLLAIPARPRTALALQELVDMAGEGCRVSIPTGRFVGEGTCARLVITRAITLQGNQSVLCFPLSVSPGTRVRARAHIHMHTNARSMRGGEREIILVFVLL